MKQLPPNERFENALRDGPRPVKVPDAFALRMENAWRRAGLEDAAPEPEILAWWRQLVAPTMALGALAMAVVWVTSGDPVRSPAPTAPELAGVSEIVDLLPAESDLAALGGALDSPYREEAELMAADAKKALRFVVASVFTPERIEQMEAQGWLPPTEGERQG